MMKILKRFGNRRLPNKVVRPWILVYRIYSIHEFYGKTLSKLVYALRNKPERSIRGKEWKLKSKEVS